MTGSSPITITDKFVFVCDTTGEKYVVPRLAFSASGNVSVNSAGKLVANNEVIETEVALNIAKNYSRKHPDGYIIIKGKFFDINGYLNANGTYYAADELCGSEYEDFYLSPDGSLSYMNKPINTSDFTSKTLTYIIPDTVYGILRRGDRMFVNDISFTINEFVSKMDDKKIIPNTIGNSVDRIIYKTEDSTDHKHMRASQLYSLMEEPEPVVADPIIGWKKTEGIRQYTVTYKSGRTEIQTGDSAPIVDNANTEKYIGTISEHNIVAYNGLKKRIIQKLDIAFSYKSDHDGCKILVICPNDTITEAIRMYEI